MGWHLDHQGLGPVAGGAEGHDVVGPLRPREGVGARVPADIPVAEASARVCKRVCA